MYNELGGRCPSCKRDCSPIKFMRAVGEDPSQPMLVIDHCHDTEEKLRRQGRRKDLWRAVRGLICDPCNKALGLMRNDPEAIDGLLNYAKFHQGEPKCKTLRLSREG